MDEANQDINDQTSIPKNEDEFSEMEPNGEETSKRKSLEDESTKKKAKGEKNAKEKSLKGMESDKRHEAAAETTTIHKRKNKKKLSSSADTKKEEASQANQGTNDETSISKKNKKKSSLIVDSKKEEANWDTNDETSTSNHLVGKNEDEFANVEPNGEETSKNKSLEDKSTKKNPNGEKTPKEKSLNKANWSARYWPLYEMIQKNDWKGVEDFVRVNPDALTTKIAYCSRTLFHLIFWLVRDDLEGTTSLIEKLVPTMDPKLLAQKDSLGRTVLTSCAMIGDTKASKIFVKYNSELPNIPDDDGYLPVRYAANCGHKDTVEYLVSVTAEEKLHQEAGSRLLSALIKSNLYDIALDILKRYPTIGRDSNSSRARVLKALAQKPLAFASGSRLGRLQRFIYYRIPVKMENVSSIDQTKEENQTVVEDVENHIVRSKEQSTKSTFFCCIPQISTTFGQHISLRDKLNMMVWNVLMYLASSIRALHEQKLKHMQMVEVVKMICGGVIWTDPQVNPTLSHSFFFTAARLGISEIVNEILMAYSLSVRWVDEDEHNVFDIAVLNRSEEVFNLIYGTGLYKGWITSTDKSGNNMLHLAGKLVPSSKIAGAALQMQRELQWFKAVENVVPASIREDENSDNKTPREVFTAEHRELAKEGEKWMKGTASSCTVVATLIITVVFAAAFTVPGGNNNDGIPNFLHAPSFIIFTISDALALFSSITSLLMFLGILTSRYSEEDFLASYRRS